MSEAKSEISSSRVTPLLTQIFRHSSLELQSSLKVLFTWLLRNQKIIRKFKFLWNLSKKNYIWKFKFRFKKFLIFGNNSIGSLRSNSLFVSFGSLLKWSISPVARLFKVSRVFVSKKYKIFSSKSPYCRKSSGVVLYVLTEEAPFESRKLKNQSDFY